MQSLIERELHHLPAHEVLFLLETNLDRGLSSGEAAERLQRYICRQRPNAK